MLALVLRLLTPVILAIVTFIVIFIVADATAGGTDRFSSLSMAVEEQTVVTRRLIQATRQTLSETTSVKLVQQWAEASANLSRELSAGQVTLNSVQARSTGTIDNSRL